MTGTSRRKLTEPLETVTAVFGTLLIVALVIGALLAVFGSGSLGGFGKAATVCATQPGISISSTPGAQVQAFATRPGSSLNLITPLQACATHPGLGQRVLFTLTEMPTILVWGGVLLLIWLILRAARRSGPFTPEVAAAMRLLGWFIIVGAVAAAAVQGFALDRLLNTMLVQRSDYGDAITFPVHALVPVPALAGVALLSFARIIRAGAAMDEEIKGTV